ncbi:MAG: glycosyltransferase, partial [Erythrobacter sp.]|nr:glycosyltransferase [Erythrobacter sp.]
AGAHFHVVGRNPTASLTAHRMTPGVTIWGEVPDVRPFISGADCVLAPLLIARGVQNKVLEAMAMARPVLLTPQAATGIAGTDGVHWMVSEADPQAMASRFESLWADRAATSRMGKAARKFVLAEHTWEAMLSPIERLVETARQEARNAA